MNICFVRMYFDFLKEHWIRTLGNSHHNARMTLLVMTSMFTMVIQVRALQEEKLEEFFQLAIARFGQFDQLTLQFTK